MNVIHSIRFRIIAALILFGLCLTVLHVGVTRYIIRDMGDRLVNNLLSTEVEYFKYQAEREQNVPLPSSKYIRMYRGKAGVPKHLREKIENLKSGIHKIRSEGPGPGAVAVINLQDNPSTYYMFFNKRVFREDLDRRFDFKQISILSDIFLITVAILIGLLTSRIILKPLENLAGKIRDLNPEKIPENLSDKSYKNEVGALATTLENTMSRIKAFIEREKQFTRDASHELRTPLTIMKGAVEIIEQQEDATRNRRIARPLSRIKRSVKDMETTIETFLWLSREENNGNETCTVTPVVKSALEKNSYLLEGKQVDVKTAFNANPVLSVPEPVLYIALTNIIRNAFNYTSTGSVTVTVEDGYIQISDTGVGIDPDKINHVMRTHVKGEQSSGFGLGLAIVKRLCDRFGWKLTIESGQGQGTSVTLLHGKP